MSLKNRKRTVQNHFPRSRCVLAKNPISGDRLGYIVHNFDDNEKEYRWSTNPYPTPSLAWIEAYHNLLNGQSTEPVEY